ncbi:hypothetical protein cyc_06277 [Cyclospora cayetanensis]|uniref:Uncharacterized protein n=1 Tax=Cyclospora cayetanensis TaxID=88456 RepID=A0A1D3D743_9EIME|nr:hypothetical protein cyc_06277 [Cyclospora cayetanensis]
MHMPAVRESMPHASPFVAALSAMLGCVCWMLFWLLQRLLEAFAGDALRAATSNNPTPSSDGWQGPLETPEDGSCITRKRKSSIIGVDDCQGMQLPPQIDGGCSSNRCSPWQPPELADEEDPFAAFYVSNFRISKRHGRASREAKASLSVRKQKQPLDKGLLSKQQKQLLRKHLRQQQPCDTRLSAGLQALRNDKGGLLESSRCGCSIWLPIFAPLPPWAAPGVLVAHCSSYNRGGSFKELSSCCNDKAHSTDFPPPRGTACTRLCSDACKIAVLDAPDTPYTAIAQRRIRDCPLEVSLIAGLQQQPPGSDGFERFALELNSLQQQGATGGTRREALFSAVLRSPLLHRAVALGGSNGVLPLSLQHLLLLLQHQQTNKLTEKAKSLILGHEAVMLGCGAMRGCRGLVVAVDAVSGTALLRLPGKAETAAAKSWAKISCMYRQGVGEICIVTCSGQDRIAWQPGRAKDFACTL